MKKLLSRTLPFLFVALILISCKDEDADPKLEFQTDNKTFSLKEAKLYLRIEGTYNGAVDYTYRDYIISDGELIDGENGWSIDDYTNATYFIAFELATAQPALPTAGNFPLYRFWESVNDGSNLSYFFGSFEGQIIDTPQTNPAPIIRISGGTEPNEKMTIAFSGKIAYRFEGGELSQFDGKLNFTGVVVDKRE